MKIKKSDLKSAAQNSIISQEQSENLWNYLNSLTQDNKFQTLHVLYYFGGILIFGSMSWFLTEAWQSGFQIMILSLIFGTSYFLVGNHLWKNNNFRIPAGLLITAVISLVPVFIYGLQKETGLWMEDSEVYKNYHLLIRERWIPMEIFSIIAAIIAIRYYKFAFLAFPLSIALWYLSMDISPLIFGISELNHEKICLVSSIFGAIVIFISYQVDAKFPDIDFAFWTYLAGIMSFWGGLTFVDSDSEISKFIYFLINIALIIFSVYLRRKAFIVFGSIGTIIYIAHLASEIFKDSHLFPLVLAFFGLFIIYIGIKYQKNQKNFENKE